MELLEAERTEPKTNRGGWYMHSTRDASWYYYSITWGIYRFFKISFYEIGLLCNLVGPDSGLGSWGFLLRSVIAHRERLGKGGSLGFWIQKPRFFQFPESGLENNTTSKPEWGKCGHYSSFCLSRPFLFTSWAFSYYPRLSCLLIFRVLATSFRAFFLCLIFSFFCLLMTERLFPVLKRRRKKIHLKWKRQEWHDMM